MHVRSSVLIVLAAGAASGAFSAAAAERPAFLEEAILQAAAGSGQPPPEVRPQAEWQNAQRMLPEIDACLQRDDPGNALRMAQQYAANARSPELRAFWDGLAGEVRRLVEAQEKEISDRVAAAVEKAKTACLAAAKAEDLDPVWEEFRALQELRNRQLTPALQRQVQRLEYAAQFLQEWQNYLGLVQAGATEQAQNVLRNLMGGSYGRYPLVARSEMLKRLGTPAEGPKPDDIARLLAEARLEDLPRLSADLRARVDTMGSPRRDLLYNLVNALDALANAYAMVLNGRYREALSGYYVQPGPWMNEISALRNRLAAVALARQLGLKEPLALRDGENAFDAVRRMADEAAAAGDWDRAVPLLESLQSLGMDEVAANELRACREYLAGLRLEEADQFAAAAVSYRETLRAGGRRVPRKEATERLKALTAAHPEAAAPVPWTGPFPLR